MRTVSIDREDDPFVATGGEAEVTSQGWPAIESLPTLADALPAIENCPADPLEIAPGVFAPRHASKEEPYDGR